jgi:hypothetical protein
MSDRDKPIARLRDDELDYDEVEETFAALRDHLRASDLVSLAEVSPEDARGAIASLLAVIRHAADSMGMEALLLRRYRRCANKSPATSTSWPTRSGRSCPDDQKEIAS